MDPITQDPLEDLDQVFTAREIISAAAKVAAFEKLPPKDLIHFGRGITKILGYAAQTKKDEAGQ